MKKFLLRSAVFIITFAVTLVVASRVLNKNQDNMTMEMGRATLPVITMLFGETAYNPLYGHVRPMDPAAQREQITILTENRKTNFNIRTYGRNVTKITYQVRSGDGERLIENTELEDFKRDGDVITGEISLKDLIEQNTEYVLAIGLTMDGWQEAWYYTRAVWDPESLLGQQLEFIHNFHKKLYYREEAKELIKYLESNSRLEANDTFHHVTIHGSFKQITWGDLRLTETRDPLYTLKEINGRDASVVVDYAVSTEASDRTTNYRVRECYKIRYSPDRTYLLAYDRTMTQIPDEKALYGGDKILLGIGDENVNMMENESGTVVAFQQADRLFSYNVPAQKMALLFSFYDPETEDRREERDESDVKILNVDEDGNVDFAVYGYVNRGTREGEVGIRICRYDAKVNTISEKAFIPWDKPYSNLKSELEELLFLSADGSLYLMLEHGVYRLDLENKTCEEVAKAYADGCLQTSEDHGILAWQQPGSDGYARTIQVRDLSENTQAELQCNADEALKILGFMGQDLIYGVAVKSEIQRTLGGKETFPAYKLVIVKADGTILKEYEQKGIYVTDVSLEENQIILERATRSEDGRLVPASQDHVTKTSQAKATKNKVSVVEIDVYEKYVQIQVNGKIDSKKVQLLTPKEVIQEGAEDFKVEILTPAESYRVYGPFGLDGSFLSAGSAIARADEISGTAYDGAGNKIWRKGDRSSRNQIMAISEPEKVSAEESLAVCLDVMLRLRGISIDGAALLERGKTPEEILMENANEGMLLELPAESLEATLYYVSRDIPVLAILEGGEAVLITGYNESQIVIFQPGTGKLYKRGMNDALKWLQENGAGFLILC